MTFNRDDQEAIRSSERLHDDLEKQAGTSKRKHFYITFRDPRKQNQVRFPCRPLIAPWFHLRLMGLEHYSGLRNEDSEFGYGLMLKLLRSTLFRQLPGKQFAVAHWLAGQGIVQACQARWTRVIFAPSMTGFRRLHGARRRCERIEHELSYMVSAAKEIMSRTLSDNIRMHEDLESAIQHLRTFRQKIGQESSQTAALGYHRRELRRLWMFRPPAISYGLFRMLTEHSEPRLLKRQTYLQIGTFEREYLRRAPRSADALVEDTVRRQIYAFRRSDERKDMDRILARLISSPCYGLQHPLNCDWETAAGPPHPSR